MKPISIGHLFGFSTLILLGTLGVGAEWFGLNNLELATFFLYWILGFLGLMLLERKGEAWDCPPLSLISLLLIAFFLWGMLGLFYSIRPEISRDFFIKYLSAILLLFSFMLYTHRPERLTQMLWTLVGLAVGHGILSWTLKALIPELGILRSSLFLNQNFYATYLLFPLALSLYFFLESKTRATRRIGLGCFVFLSANLWLTGSRGGLIAEAVLLTLILFFSLRDRNFKEAGNIVAAWMVSFLIYRIASMTLSLPGGDPESELFQKEEYITSLYAREMFWVGAWKNFLHYPLLGSGPWTFMLIYPPLAPLGSILPHHAHSLLAQTASDSGLIGLGLLLAVLGFWFKTLSATLQTGPPQSRKMALCLGAGLTAFCVHNLIEYSWPTPVLFGTFVLWAVFTERLPAPPSLSRWRLPRPLFQGAAYVLIGVALLTLFIQSGYEYAMKRARSESMPAPQRIEWSGTAQTFCPGCDFPHLNLAVLFGMEFERTGDCKWLRQAEQEIDQAFDKAPINPEALMLRGILLELQGDYPKSLAWYTQAWREGRNRKDPMLAIERVAKRRNAQRNSSNPAPSLLCRSVS